MDFTHLIEIFLQECLSQTSWSNGPRYVNTEEARMNIVVKAKQCL